MLCGTGVKGQLIHTYWRATGETAADLFLLGIARDLPLMGSLNVNDLSDAIATSLRRLSKSMAPPAAGTDRYSLSNFVDRLIRLAKERTASAAPSGMQQRTLSLAAFGHFAGGGHHVR